MDFSRPSETLVRQLRPPNALREVTIDPNMIPSPQHCKKIVDEKPIILPGDKPERVFGLAPCPRVASTALGIGGDNGKQEDNSTLFIVLDTPL